MKKIIISTIIACGLFAISGLALAEAIIIIPAPPTDIDECKKGGWEYLSYNGVLFKNQGDCVSFVATGYTNLPAGPVIE